MAFLLDGKPLPVDKPFSYKDINYPRNWLRLSTPEEKAAINITEVADPKKYNETYYSGSGTEKLLAEVKLVLLAEDKETAYQLLSIHDWQVIRKAEKGTALSSQVATFRDSVRATGLTRETEINNAKTIPELETLMNGTWVDGKRTAGITVWPENPDLS